MEFGFSLPGRGPLAGIDIVLKLAEKADALRFDSLFVTTNREGSGTATLRATHAAPACRCSSMPALS